MPSGKPLALPVFGCSGVACSASLRCARVRACACVRACSCVLVRARARAVSYTHLRAHETSAHL
eukprot:8033783-Alexandrium_andersonii.AAC.1